MSTVCPHCGHQMVDPRAICPRCAGLGPQRAAPPGGSAAPGWQQTPWGRILIGLLLSQGLFYGLRQLLTGVLLVTGDVAEDESGQFRHLLLFQGMQMLALLLGGVLAGGGQRSGLVLGAVVGVWNGVLSVMLRQNPSQ